MTLLQEDSRVSMAAAKDTLESAWRPQKAQCIPTSVTLHFETYATAPQSEAATNGILLHSEISKDSFKITFERPLRETGRCTPALLRLDAGDNLSAPNARAAAILREPVLRQSGPLIYIYSSMINIQPIVCQLKHLGPAQIKIYILCYHCRVAIYWPHMEPNLASSMVLWPCQIVFSPSILQADKA
ncbi:hypothetical protein PoB_005442200 [Plakobranchus ocellatus]|uniref:Uncharacterized protein n=1 Tax=Plakobranchus ocellatus TaxID=259542 RepID=A0AAV4C9I5_9GAST|nr:hypothetical protein PoB_005442200 [Plakobranchus ocellatus]